MWERLPTRWPPPGPRPTTNRYYRRTDAVWRLARKRLKDPDRSRVHQHVIGSDRRGERRERGWASKGELFYDGCKVCTVVALFDISLGSLVSPTMSDFGKRARPTVSKNACGLHQSAISARAVEEES